MPMQNLWIIFLLSNLVKVTPQRMLSIMGEVRPSKIPSPIKAMRTLAKLSKMIFSEL